MAGKLVPNPDPGVIVPIPHEPVATYFPVKTAPPAPNTFEIGLVLGGTVSAAAYTAGVVDFLVQALDAWTVAKFADSENAPSHNVRIKILTGTSGGAITCALLAKVLGYAYPHCDAATPAAQQAQNPLYDCWVNQIDINDLLVTTDVQRTGRIDSLLCADKIDRVGTAIANYKGQPLGTSGTPAVRDYVEQLLPIVITLTNLRGIPFSSDFRGTSGRPEYYTDFADHMRFLVDITGKNPPTREDLKPYEVGISESAAPTVQPWQAIVHAARGSSAFPVGLPPQTIARDLKHYSYRYAAINGQSGPEAVWLKPSWPYMTPIGASAADPYQFLAVDGGCFNNEPIEFARQWLAGVLSHNEQSGTGAHRAVVLVDPFADTPDYGLVNNSGILDSAGATLSAWKNGARYETADLDLFTAEDVFSRFLINPVRKDSAGRVLAGGDAIATDSMAAFGGFLCRSFRAHDYFLGRRNCQQFLRTSFVLDRNNALFDTWTAPQRTRFGSDVPGFLPIVPLMASVAAELPQPTWPKNTFNPESIRGLLESRLGKLVEIGSASIVKSQFFLTRWILDLVLSKTSDAATDKAIASITKALRDADLL